MTQSRYTALRKLTIATGFGIAAGFSGIAAAQDVPLSTCFGAVGTYLTENEVTADGSLSDVGRSLLALTNGGHAFLIDSNEAGIDQFAGFTAGLGAWECVSEGDGTLHLVATVMDFTDATADHPEQQIARLDYTATFTIESDMLEAEAALYFLPLDADATDTDALPDPFRFAVLGRRVTTR